MAEKSTATTKTLENIKLNPPTPFTRKRTDFILFMQDVYVYLKVNKATYNNDDKKISFILSYLTRGDAAVTILSGFHQVALRLGPNGLRPQGLKEYSDSYSVSDYLGPVLGSKCLVMQTLGDYFGLGPSEETSEKMFQVATRTFNLLYYYPFMYTYWSHFSG
jgi:hypothetical protein